MARCTAHLSLQDASAKVDPQLISETISQALTALGLELQQVTRLQVVATCIPGGAWPIAFQVLLSWCTPLPACDAVDISLELQSREPMATGAPITGSALQQLLLGLTQQLPKLEITSRP